ncbi:MAG: hypothetical protein AAF550_00775 [Myxococcota bacterium]
MPFAYYKHLNSVQKEAYQKSNRVANIRIPEAASLQELVPRMQQALLKKDRAQVERIGDALCRGINQQLGVEPVKVTVLLTRPSSARSELHGLYVRRPNAVPHIRVWMRTAVRNEVVRLRTFLRTLMHELCHHLDFAYLDFEESFHTQGFYRRESSLVRQLAPKPICRTKDDSPPDLDCRTRDEVSEVTKARRTAIAFVETHLQRLQATTEPAVHRDASSVDLAWQIRQDERSTHKRPSARSKVVGTQTAFSF